MRVDVSGVSSLPSGSFQGCVQTLGDGSSIGLGTLPNGGFSESYGTFRGTTVGSGHVVTDDGNNFVRAFAYSNGFMQSLDSVSNFSQATALNANWIVGTADFNDHPFNRPTVWNRGTGEMIEVGNLIRGTATAINSHDSIVGNRLTPDALRFAFRMDSIHSSAVDIALPGASFFESLATGINDSGDVSGYYFDASNGARQAFIARIDGSVVYPSALGGTWNALTAINNDGIAVGQFLSPTDGPQAYLWDPNLGAMNLNDLIHPDSGWNLLSAHAISDHGHIAGFGTDPFGVTRGYVVVIPNPGTAVSMLVILGGGGLYLRRRRA
jgi:hypothetical protein